jgi:hypothetical protein
MKMHLCAHAASCRQLSVHSEPRHASLCLSRRIWAFLLVPFLYWTLASAVQAQYNFNTNMDGTITVTGYTGSGVTVAFPSTINGRLVSSITLGYNTNLTSVTIPNGVTQYGVELHGCTSLTNITVDPLNTNYSSLQGVMFDKNQGLLIAYPVGRVGDYIVPNSVTSIWYQAFLGSKRLTRVTIPENVRAILDSAFIDSELLTHSG